MQRQLWQSDGIPGDAGPVTYIDPTTQEVTDLNGVFQIVNDNGVLEYVAVNPSDGLPKLDTYDLETVPRTLVSFASQQQISNPTVVGSDLFFDAPVPPARGSSG